MPVVVATITLGALMVYSALTGKSFTEIFSGDVGGTLNPAGGRGGGGGSVPSGPSASDPLTTPDSGGLPGVEVGTTIIDGKPVYDDIAVVVLWARKHGWSGRVTSGIRSDSEQRQACINVCGNPNGCPGRCAAPGTSNHRPRSQGGEGAIDVTREAEFARVISMYPGGPPIKNDLPQDRVHFSRSGH